MTIKVSNLSAVDLENILLNHFNSLQLRSPENKPLPDYQHDSSVPYRYSHNSLNQEAQRDITNSMRANGIVILERFLDATTTDRAREIIENVVEDARPAINRNEHADLGNAVLQIGDREDKPYKNYAELVTANKPVINYRGGNKVLHNQEFVSTDKGLIDIFNVLNLNHELAEIFSFFKHPALAKAVGDGVNQIMTSLQTNSYINESITRTRGFHLDNLQYTAKAFVYLSDVNSLADGPYCYGLGSHANEKLRAINSLLSQANNFHKYDYTLLKEEDRLACLAPKGSMIISYQFGAHRGAPQKEGHKRILVVNTIGKV